MSNTQFTYLYRDASNYKQYHRVILAGRLTKSQVDAIVSKCNSGEYFLAHQVGLPELQRRWEEQNCKFPTEDDHYWHELDGIGDTDDKPTFVMTAQELYEKFLAVDSWDEREAARRLDLE